MRHDDSASTIVPSGVVHAVSRRLAMHAAHLSPFPHGNVPALTR